MRCGFKDRRARRQAGIGLPAWRLARGIAIVARAQMSNCGEQRTTGTPVRLAFGRKDG
ncbi:hypothetical protein BO443_30439 [Burkholderia orbicola]